MLDGLLQSAEHAAWKASHSRSIVTKASDIIKSFYTATAALLAYGTYGGNLFEDSYEAALSGVETRRDSLKMDLLNQPDKPPDMAAVAEVDSIVNKGIALLAKTKQSLDSGDKLSALVRSTSDQAQLQQSFGQGFAGLNSLIQAESLSQEQNEQREARARSNVRNFLILGVVINVMAALLLVKVFVGTVTKRLSVILDNTERLASRKQLNALIGGDDEIARLDVSFHGAAEQLAVLEEMKARFFAMVSHELRTPISSIQITFNLLHTGALGEQSPEASKRTRAAEQNCLRLLRLVNDVLDVHKQESGKFQLSYSTFELADVVIRAVESVKPQAEKKRLSLESTVCPGSIEADSERVEQVLVNLIGNATKYAPSGTTISVIVEEEGDSALFKVIDKGPGIPPGVVDRLFEIYVQEKAETGSSGLGLFICKGLVESHGGKIGVETEINKGATFYFRIPRSRVDQNDAKPDVQ